jgi:cell division protein FtsW (lipid II flippase)
VFDAINFFLKPFLSILAFYVLTKSFLSLKDNRPQKSPLIMLKGKKSDNSIPVMYWENSIGRSKSSDIFLSDMTLSRDHAVLYRRKKGWFISDTDSKAGVIVNGKKIEKPKILNIDDEIKLGSDKFLIKNTTSYEDEYDLASVSKKIEISRSSGQKLLLLAVNFFHFCLAVQVLFSKIKKYKKNDANLITEYLSTNEIFDVFAPFLIVFVSSWIFFFISKFILGRKNFEIESIGIFLSGVGIILVGSEKLEDIYMQAFCFIIGFFGFCFLVFFMRNLENMSRLRSIVTIAAVLFFLLNLVLAKEYNGSKNWIMLGSVFIQPSEFVKIAFVFVGASTLDKLQTKKNLGGFILFSAFCIGCLFLMRDFGTACVFFVAFLVSSFMRSGSIRTVILSCSAAVMGAFIILNFKPYVAARFSVWQHVLENSQTGGYQQARALSYASSGGLLGIGCGNGSLRYIFAGTSDLMFPTIVEELGLIIGIVIILMIAFLAFFARNSSEKCRSTFYSISSCTAAAILVFQASLHIFGSTDVLPLTGVTLPFLSLGGSSMISTWGMLAFIKACDNRTYFYSKG